MWIFTHASAACVAVSFMITQLISNLNEVCFQRPAFLLGTTLQGGNEVMLVRNTLIYQYNGPPIISQGAVLSCTNQMPGNDFFFYFLKSKRSNITKLLPSLASAAGKPTK